MNRVLGILVAGVLVLMGVVVAFTMARQQQQPGSAATGPAIEYGWQNLNAVLWTQTSTEYAASARQAYRVAQLMVDAALEDPSWTAALEQIDQAGLAQLPPAVILDVDETVLDNGPNQARQILDDVEFNRDDWHAWVREEQAAPVPGALDFTRYAADRGVTVFYVTNRRHEVEDATVANLRAHGFPLVDGVDTTLTRDERPDWGSDKGTRRAAVGADHRILLLIGDNLGDFISGVDTTVEARAALAEPYADWWGTRWIMLPNPQYGSWDGALIGFDFSLSPAAKRRLRAGALDPAR